MKIESLTRITGAHLLNSPYVSSIEGICFDLQKIQRGNLFIDLQADETSHEIAVKNGAYAILSSVLPKILDDEIAWLHVKDLELSLIKLARFFASTKDLSFVLLNKLQFELIKSLQLNIQTNLLCESISGAMLDILHVKQKTLFFVTDDTFIQKIDPTFKSIQSTIMPQKLFSKGLFYSSYIFNEVFFSEIRLPSFLIPYLCAVQNFFEQQGIDYKIDGFANFSHFHPIFVNNALEKKDFGSSEKVIIYEKDKYFFDKALEYILKEVGEDRLTLLLPPKLLETYPKGIQKYGYKNKEDLIRLIEKPFHYVLVMDDFTTFETPLSAKPKQMNLF